MTAKPRDVSSKLQRHDRAMEQGRGISFCTNTSTDCIGSYKHGQGVTAKKKKCRKDNKNTVWHNYQCAIERTRRRMRVPYFRVFMCNMLSTSGAHRNESIVNLDNATGPGTHWVAYAKRNNRVVYFDSFGNLRSPKELVRYFGNESL